MIPYFELHVIPIAGNVSLAAFGTLVAVGVFVGVAFAESRARAVGIPATRSMRRSHGRWFRGSLMAHLVALVPHLGDPAAWSPRGLLQFWNGMSSFGGFVGAYLGVAYYCRRAGQSWLPLTEVLVQSLVVGWGFGRLGCTLVHDHIGRPSTCWLAIRFPNGPRHDLGFYEFGYTMLVLVPAVFVLNRKARPPGATIAWMALLYAPARFLGDFLRNTDLPGADVRHLGLTLAQYACIGLAGVGVAFARRIRRGTT